MKLVYPALTLGFLIAALAAFSKVRAERNLVTEECDALKNARASVRFGAGPYLAWETKPAAQVSRTAKTADGLIREVPDSRQEVWKDDARMLYGLVDVVNDPPYRHNDAVAKNAYISMTYEEVLPDGSLEPAYQAGSGVWHGPPILSPDPEQREQARLRDLLPNGDVRRIFLFRHNGQGFFAAYPKSFERSSSTLDILAIDEKWQLPADEYRITIRVNGSNMDELIGRFRLRRAETTPEGVLSWWD
jgi:hypothetical protein